MDPLNQMNIMRLQEPLPTALDLSMGCRQIPIKAASVEALDLVKKSSWSDRNSGTNSRVVGVPAAPDGAQLDPASGFGYEPRYCSVPLHNPNTMPLLDGLAALAQMPSPCPPLDPEFIEHGRTGVRTDHMFTHPSRNPLERLIAVSQNARTHTDTLTCTRGATKRARNMLNGLDSESQYSKGGCGGQNTDDTVLPRTRSKGFVVPQDRASPTPSLHSTSSMSMISEDSSIVERPSLVPKQTAVETLSSECSYSDANSLCSVEYISSDDSDIIEVPVNSSTCKNSNGDRSPAGSVMAEELSNERDSPSPPRPEYSPRSSTDCEHVKNACSTDDLTFHDIAETLESSEVSSPILLQDSDPDTDAFVPKSVPSTSDAENADILKPPQDQAPSLSPHKKSPPPKRAAPPKRKRPTNPKPKKKSSGKTWTKPSPRSKAAAPVKRRGTKSRQSKSTTSMFSPEEPEIKLKYANHKEEKREGKGDGFAPYIRMEFSACTVVNFQDDDGDVKAKKGRQSLPSSGVSGTVPTTSCLRLGRLNPDSRSQTSQLCSLCGWTANAVGLGDLHGPYYPWGPQPEPCCSPVVVSRDSGLTHSLNGGEMGRFLDHEERTPADLPREHCVSDEWAGAPEWSNSCKERWVHEDCIIWSSGVFLVKGKLYGLEEAVRLAGETVCSCCHRAGATLGCFFKGCPSKYHFPCALQTGCLFNEENFTIRCPKHKNKSPRSSLSRLQNR